MNYIELFQTQAELDSRIVEGKGLEGQDLIQENVLALSNEIQEVAKETRCFKYWSNKERDNSKVLEELADVLHCILTLGNDLRVAESEVEGTRAKAYKDLVTHFNVLSYTVSCMSMFNDKARYYFETISLFKGLVALLGFTEEQLEEAYYIKNKVNHERQATGY